MICISILQENLYTIFNLIRQKSERFYSKLNKRENI